ncbi:hypothetical protein L1887_60618 [Cichorium endivia]|nr:hypothetical protein L1887_60618 [Cichorium endivia]
MAVSSGTRSLLLDFPASYLQHLAFLDLTSASSILSSCNSIVARINQDPGYCHTLPNCLAAAGAAHDTLDGLDASDDVLCKHRLEEEAEERVEHDGNEECNVEGAREGDEAEQVKQEARRRKERPDGEEEQQHYRGHEPHIGVDRFAVRIPCAVDERSDDVLERRDEKHRRVLRVGRVEFVRVDLRRLVPVLATRVAEGPELKATTDGDLSNEADEDLARDEVGGGCARVDGRVDVRVVVGHGGRTRRRRAATERLQLKLVERCDAEG